MMKPVKVFLLIASGLLLLSCSKSEDPVLKDVQPGFDPAIHKEETNRVLQLKGSYKTYTSLPSKSLPRTISAFGFSEIVDPPEVYFRENWMNPGIMDTIEIGNETVAQIPVNFTDFPNTNLTSWFRLINIYFKVTGSTGRWKIPVPNNSLQVGGPGLISLTVPSLVREGNFKITICAELACNLPGYDTLRIFTDTMNALLAVRPPIKCGGDSITGGAGLTVWKLDFGPDAKAGKVKIRFKTFGFADRLEVRFGNKFVVSSCKTGLPDPFYVPKCSDQECWDITGYNWKNYEFDFDPAYGRYAECLVYGWCGNLETLWQLSVSCPQ